MLISKISQNEMENLLFYLECHHYWRKILIGDTSSTTTTTKQKARRAQQLDSLMIPCPFCCRRTSERDVELVNFAVVSYCDRIIS